MVYFLGLNAVVAIARVVAVWATAIVLGFGEGVVDGVMTLYYAAAIVLTTFSHNSSHYRFLHT